MGSDDLFHKRKAKDKKALARKKAKRSGYRKILIVCEGQKTEPNYFNELKDHYEINTANVVIDGTSESDPMSVFRHAQKCVKKAQKDQDPYDEVYCVFDKDTHTTYQQALTKIKKAKGYVAIASVPCFEYWLLLHFVYTTQPFSATGHKSAGDKVIEELKCPGRLPNYQKAASDTFAILLPHLDRLKNELNSHWTKLKPTKPITHLHMFTIW